MVSDRARAILFAVSFFAALLSGAVTSHSGGMPKSFLSKDDVMMHAIPGGAFVMGSKDEDLAQISPVHKVYLKTFYMDEHQVTNRQFAEFLNHLRPSEKLVPVELNTDVQENTPEEGGESGEPEELEIPKTSERLKMVVLRSDIEVEGRKGWWPTEILLERGKYVALEGFEEYPVVAVSYDAALKYCKWVGKRLPTEAEWEKAARGGLNQKKFPWGDSIPTQGVIYNRQWIDNMSPPPLENVKTYLPNGFGLYNMAGLVWEWCSDWFAPYYYKDSPKKDPQGPEAGEFKVLRGGSWFNAANALRVALRNFIVPQALDETTGFRCAADLPGEHNVKR